MEKWRLLTRYGFVLGFFLSDGIFLLVFVWVPVSSFIVHSRSESYFLTIGGLMGKKEVSSGALLDDVVVLFFLCR